MRLSLNSALDTSANVSIGDINGDGTLDVLLVNGRHSAGRSQVMLGDGHGHFPTVYPLTADRYRSYSGQLVDLDGDGHLDVVAHMSATTITPADVNRDGLIDLVVPARDGAQSVVYLNDGKGDFAAAKTVPLW